MGPRRYTPQASSSNPDQSAEAVRIDDFTDPILSAITYRAEVAVSQRQDGAIAASTSASEHEGCAGRDTPPGSRASLRRRGSPLPAVVECSSRGRLGSSRPAPLRRGDSGSAEAAALAELELPSETRGAVRPAPLRICS